ncbi:MAG TPA: MbnH family di-heme enzyme [Polyangiaceae bacterium]
MTAPTRMRTADLPGSYEAWGWVARALSAAAILAVAGGCSDDNAGAPPHSHHHHEDGGHSHDDAAGHAHDDGGTPVYDGGPPPDGSVIGDFQWNLPPGFPLPAVPTTNPMSVEKVELGRHLFHDTRLSDNQTQSCASCHEQRFAFADARARAVGSTGITHPRSSMSLTNVAYTSTLTWGHPLMNELERQAEAPLLGDQPVELGLKSLAQIEERLRPVTRYHELFAAAFPGEAQPITAANTLRALATFERTLISGRSPYDRFLYQGQSDALSESAKRGYQLFNAEKFECFHCHTSFNLSDHTNYEGKAFVEMPFHNTGLYNIGGTGAYPAPNTGAHSVTGNPSDMGKFKAPSLRNIAVTAPYMHDGSIATLSEVLDHYAAGGRRITSGPHAGDGNLNPLKDRLIRKFDMTEQERADVLAFLESLTDQEFLTNPAFSDPWTAVAAPAH